jgi:hypothetical protein
LPLGQSPQRALAADASGPSDELGDAVPPSTAAMMAELELETTLNEASASIA